MRISADELSGIAVLQATHPAQKEKIFEQARSVCFRSPGMNAQWLKVCFFIAMLYLLGFVLFLLLLISLGLRQEYLVIMTALFTALAIFFYLKRARSFYISLVVPFIEAPFAETPKS